MHEFGTTPEMLASVAVKNHHNGCLDPYAHFQNEITVDQVLASPSGLQPAPAPRLLPPDRRGGRHHPHHAERALSSPTSRSTWPGFGVATDHPYLHEKSTFVSLPATTVAAGRAYDMAGVGPGDMDMAEVHDCFTITEILDIEDLGFVEKGKGGPASLAGETALDGRIPVNPSGGLLAKGHPIGATGAWPSSPSAGGSCAKRPGSARWPSGRATPSSTTSGAVARGCSVVNILTRNTA